MIITSFYPSYDSALQAIHERFSVDVAVMMHVLPVHLRTVRKIGIIARSGNTLKRKNA